jgi:hypothetical protein
MPPNLCFTAKQTPESGGYVEPLDGDFCAYPQPATSRVSAKSARPHQMPRLSADGPPHASHVRVDLGHEACIYLSMYLTIYHDYMHLPMGVPILRCLWCLQHALRRAIWVIILEQGTLSPLWNVLVNGEWLAQHFCPF